jgi:peptidoglycan/LPS O-acetylase OafA/YrhL
MFGGLSNAGSFRKMKYRAEIDGLRAIAVLPVILFHGGIQTFSGGYVGVDVFFVISGYLITTIILDEKRANTFSLFKFYERRARRILPALYLVMLVSLPVSWALMLPDDFENFGQSLVATVFFGNNILLWLTSGYFALANEFKPLMHTWSLAIEEQYYLLFPILLLLTWRWRWSVIVIFFIFLTLASLAIALWGTKYAEFTSAAFYLLPARGWELLCGVLVAFYLDRIRETGAADRDHPLIRQIGGLMGLSLILFSVFSFDKLTPNPSLRTLLPVAGAAFVIIFATQETVVGRLLSGKLLVAIGLISYSTYLWHQPVIAFIRLNALEEPSTLQVCEGLLLAVILAYLTWRFVEKPFRCKVTIATAHVATLSVCVGLLLALSGWIIHANSGFKHLWPALHSEENTTGQGLNRAYNLRPFQFKDARFEYDSRRKILVIGDSFARDFINAGLENGYFSGGQLSYSNIVPTCLGRGDLIDVDLKNLITNADFLIFGSPSISFECWRDDFAALKTLGVKKIIVIGAKNFGWNINAVMRLPEQEKYRYRTKVLKEVWASNDEMARALPDAYFVNVLATISDEHGRVAVFTEDGKLISQDGGHLTQAGAKYIGKLLFEHKLLVELK